jgi:ferredoxin
MPKLTVLIDSETRVLDVQVGANLRMALLEAGVSPYAPLTRKLNCGGRGLCATCGVLISAGEPEPMHWHDRIGNRFGYPRLSCQIRVDADMTVRIMTDKIVWGKRGQMRRRRTADGR